MINTSLLDQTTNYKIYLVNKGKTNEIFWCFLQQPEGLTTSKVFANSDTILSVLPNYEGTNFFTIPLQYVVAAGVSNKAVGLNVKIYSNEIKNAQLQSAWMAEYVNAPPKKGPQLQLEQGNSAPDGKMVIKSNRFDQVNNDYNKWYSNMSFGIQSIWGFMGFTWAPSPNTTYTITPKFAFYIATGSFERNSLASVATISNGAAKVELKDFKDLEATVTLNSKGELVITPGAPGK